MLSALLIGLDGVESALLDVACGGPAWIGTAGICSNGLATAVAGSDSGGIDRGRALPPVFKLWYDVLGGLPICLYKQQVVSSNKSQPGMYCFRCSSLGPDVCLSSYTPGLHSKSGPILEDVKDTRKKLLAILAWS